MSKSTRGASAPKFLVISDSSHVTRYTGTREQLIALGIACPDHFPEGRKRVKREITPISDSYVDDFRTEKLKGDRFEFRKWHAYRAPVSSDRLSHFSLTHKSGDTYRWELIADDLDIVDDQAEERIKDILCEILDITEAAKIRTKKNRFKVITGGSTQ